eukprot:SAG31_NODE_22793_length_517_cov_1.715311_1_plen_81_part_00
MHRSLAGNRARRGGCAPRPDGQGGSALLAVGDAQPRREALATACRCRIGSSRASRVREAMPAAVLMPLWQCAAVQQWQCT